MFPELHREIQRQKQKKKTKYGKAYLKSIAFSLLSQDMDKRIANFSNLMSSKNPEQTNE